MGTSWRRHQYESDLHRQRRSVAGTGQVSWASSAPQRTLAFHVIALLSIWLVGTTWAEGPGRHELTRPDGRTIVQTAAPTAVQRTPTPQGSASIRQDTARTASLTIDTQPDLEQFVLPQPIAPPHVENGINRHQAWNPTLMRWTAPNFYHRPLYFEEPNRERYGQYVQNWHMASAISVAHFFGTVPLLPYKIGQHPPCERQYVLGYGRPGDWQCRQLPFSDPSLRGGMTQAAAIAGMVLLIP